MKKLNQTEAVLREEIIARKLATEELLDGELSISFMQNCHSKVNLYLSLVRPEDVDAAYNKPARIEAGKEQAKKNRARDWWGATDGAGLQQRATAANTVGSQFQKLYPQFVSMEENTTQIVDFIKSQGKMFSLESVISAYQHLCSQGLLWITPENCGLEGSEAVRGKMLTSIKGWERVLEPVKVLSDSEKEQQRIDSLSADEWAAENPVPQSLPKFEIDRRIRVAQDFENRHPEFDANEDSWEILTNWFDEFIQTPEGRGVQFGIPALELGYIQSYSKLVEGDFFWSEAPSKPVKHGITTIVDHRKPHIPTLSADTPTVEIREVSKKFTRQQILSMDLKTYTENMQKYGKEFEDAVNAAF